MTSLPLPSTFAPRLARALPLVLLALASPIALSLAACSADYGGNGFGATQGGVQDMGLARELIAEGTVPPAEAFVVEGMFSEHDLPLAGAACERTLCLRGAGAVAPDRDDAPAGWVQLGLSSTIDPATFERPPVTLIATVDVSGSMQWGSDEDSPGEISRGLLHALVDQLHEGDELAIVTYGSSVSVPVPLGAVDAGSLHAAIAGLSENGSTNLEAGLTTALGIARTARRREPGRIVRLMLFTDEQPNVGATTPEAFGGIVASAAVDDIGITVFGAGRGLGQDIFLAMSHLHGGNAFSLFHQSEVETLIEENWPFLLVPIAFDLHVEVQLGDGLSLTRGYGFPAAEAEGSPTLEASTVFLSRRRGAFLLQLAGSETALAGGDVVLSLTYTEPDGTRVEESLDVQLPSPAEGALDAHTQATTRSTVALAQLVDGMHEAATEYALQRPRAIETMRATHARIVADSASASDASLAEEVELAASMLSLMERGAPQR